MRKEVRVECGCRPPSRVHVTRRIALVLLVLTAAALFQNKWLWFAYSYVISGHHLDRAPGPAMSRDETMLIANIREAGLRGDITKMQLIRLGLLQSGWATRTTALLAAGRLECAEAEALLPLIDRIGRENFETEIGELADVTIARIKTSREVGPPASATLLVKRVRSFQESTRLSSAQIEGASLAFNVRHSYPPRQEVFAMRCLAEITCDAIQRGVPRAQTVSGIDFSADFASNLKIRLARMSARQRIDWLIEAIARKRTFTGRDYYLVRALVDEGNEAIDPVTDKLRFLKRNRRGYAYPGIKSLFRVLDGIGDIRAVAILREYVGDNDQWLDYYARQSISSIENGFRKPYNIDY